MTRLLRFLEICLLIILLSSFIRKTGAEVCAHGPYRYLALEGGGVRGITYAGAIQALDDAGILKGIRGFSGTSAGSLGAALLAAGYSGAEVASELRSTDFNLFLDSTGNKLRDLSRLLATYGWHKGDVLQQVVDELLHRKLGVANVTFRQLYAATGKELRIAATCVNNGTLVYFDRMNFGDMQVARAVRASSSIPFFFRPVEFRGNLYVDGGLLRSLPLDAFAEKQSHEAILGLSLMRSGRISGVARHESFESLPEFALQLFAIFGSSASNGDYNPDDAEADLVSFNLTGVDPTAFSLCESHKRFLVSVGYNKMADRLVACGHAKEQELRRPEAVELGACHVENFGADRDEDLSHAWRLVNGALGVSLPGKTGTYSWHAKAAAGTTLLATLASTLCWRKRRWLLALLRRNKQDRRELPDVSSLSDDACIALQKNLCDELCLRLANRK